MEMGRENVYRIINHADGGDACPVHVRILRKADQGEIRDELAACSANNCCHFNGQYNMGIARNGENIEMAMNFGHLP